MPGLRTRLIHGFFLLRRPMTLGVRVIIRDDDDRVLLVRHSYVPGWHLPGGGVEKGETIAQAAAKELIEETGIEAAGTMELLAFFANQRASKRDHVALVMFADWQQKHEFKPNREIAETGFFARNGLPPDTTSPTASRIEEAFGNRNFPAYW
jgi:ADP-ribose pyrophosphatase YjhB (NUDIX family)